MDGHSLPHHSMHIICACLHTILHYFSYICHCKFVLFTLGNKIQKRKKKSGKVEFKF